MSAAVSQQLPGSATPTQAVTALPSQVLGQVRAGGVFPVFGEAATFTDDYAAARPGTGWHHGIDIYAPIGTPVLAVADGTIFSVGVNTLGGNRLWLRDAAGTTYYYAHLSAYVPGLADGVSVRAGQVIAFVGNTGQAITTPPHLHFEIHPGDGDAINPFTTLRAWRGEGSALVPAAPAAVPQIAPVTAPARGAVLVGADRPARDAATGDGQAVVVR